VMRRPPHPNPLPPGEREPDASRSWLSWVIGRPLTPTLSRQGRRGRTQAIRGDHG